MTADSTPPEESFYLKVARADDHLNSLKGRLAAYSEPRPYTLRKRIDPNTNKWVIRIFVDAPADPMLPIIAGDFLFNLRSALDHVAVAQVPADRKDKASFPIFTKDPYELDSATGHYLQQRANERRAWERATKGMPANVVTAITELQPFTRGKHGEDPANHVLALLAQFQNADKHRQLVTVAFGLRPTLIELRQPGYPTRTTPVSELVADDDVLRNGAEVFHGVPDNAYLKIVGSAVAAFGVDHQGPYREFPRTFDAMRFMTEAAIGRIDIEGQSARWEL